MRRSRVVALAIAAIVALAGCAGDEPTTSANAPDAPAASATSSGAAPAGRALVVPDVSVVDVATGAKVALRGAVATDRPTLLWAWAPY